MYGGLEQPQAAATNEGPRRSVGGPGRGWLFKPAMLVLALCAAACTAQDRPRSSSAATERDSSGVRIVSNDEPGAGLPRLVLNDRPDLAIETQEGVSLFTLFRVTFARTLSNGRYVISSGLDLLWFDSDGRFLARNGGRGGGASEFTGLVHIALLSGDTILGLNAHPPSAKLFNPDGQYVRSLALSRSLPVKVGRLANGTWVGLAFMGESPPEMPGLFREQWALTRYDQDLSLADPVARFPGRMLYGDRSQSVYVPAGPDVVLSAGADRFAAASSDRYEISVYDSIGKLRLLIRNTAPAPPVSAAALEERKNRRNLPLEPGSPARSYRPPVPTFGPTFDALLFARNGALWVRRWDSGRNGREWHIYDTGGRLSAVAHLPANFRPTEITDSHVLGIWQDEFDVESVRLYRLMRMNPSVERPLSIQH